MQIFVLTFALGAGACASQAPRWTASQALPRGGEKKQPAMLFPPEQPEREPGDAQYSDDFVPERDVAAAELQRRVELAARTLDDLAVRTHSDVDESMLTLAGQRLEDARLTAEALRTAPRAQWKRQRMLAAAAVGRVEQCLVALSSRPPAPAAAD